MSEVSGFYVNIDGPIAVYVQIENQVQFAIASGRLKPGDTLPSVRDMSSMLNVNPNTVTKAYRDLELMDLVRPRRGVGVTVSERAPQVARDRTTQMVREHLMDAVAECSACGMSKQEIVGLAGDTVERGLKPYQGSAE